MSPKNSATRVLRRGDRRRAIWTVLRTRGEANDAGSALLDGEAEVPPLPVRHQGEGGTSPGQREQIS